MYRSYIVYAFNYINDIDDIIWCHNTGIYKIRIGVSNGSFCDDWKIIIVVIDAKAYDWIVTKQHGLTFYGQFHKDFAQL